MCVRVCVGAWTREKGGKKEAATTWTWSDTTIPTEAKSTVTSVVHTPPPLPQPFPSPAYPRTDRTSFSPHPPPPSSLPRLREYVAIQLSPRHTGQENIFRRLTKNGAFSPLPLSLLLPPPLPWTPLFQSPVFESVQAKKIQMQHRRRRIKITTTTREKRRKNKHTNQTKPNRNQRQRGKRKETQYRKKTYIFLYTPRQKNTPFSKRRELPPIAFVDPKNGGYVLASNTTIGRPPPLFLPPPSPPLRRGRPLLHPLSHSNKSMQQNASGKTPPTTQQRTCMTKCRIKQPRRTKSRP